MGIRLGIKFTENKSLRDSITTESNGTPYNQRLQSSVHKTNHVGRVGEFWRSLRGYTLYDFSDVKRVRWSHPDVILDEMNSFRCYLQYGRSGRVFCLPLTR